MPPSRTGDLTATIAILGLVVRKADTVTGVRQRLTEAFPHCGWSPSVAYADLESLEEQGFLCLAEKGETRGQDRYEATQKGRERFREWLRSGSGAGPALHDSTRARLILCEEEDLPVLLPLLRAEQEICSERFDLARWRLNKERRSARFGPGDSKARTLTLALMEYDAVMWGNQALRLKRLQQTLEGHDNDVELRQDGKRDG